MPIEKVNFQSNFLASYQLGNMTLDSMIKKDKLFNNLRKTN